MDISTLRELKKRLFSEMNLYAGKIDKPQKCEYCKEPATKGYLWAEGRAYIPVCEDHREKVKKQIEVTNKDEISGIRDIPKKASKKEASMNPRQIFEHVLLVNRVASRYATEFPTEEALKKYLKDHPDADKSKHKVKKKEESTTSKADDDFSDLPQDLTKLTESQTKKVINHMSKWPLSKLRKHQDLVDKQTEKAYDAKDDKALTNLQIQRKHLDSAVDKKEFGE